MRDRDELRPDGVTATRRAVLLGAGAASAAGLLAACGGGGAGGGGGAATPTTPSTITVKAADVPVGGGKIGGGAVVTQPAAGTFKAFTSTCTHMGCTVGTVEENRIKCPCHGSQFDATTGDVVNGPATKALAAKTVTVRGADLVVS